MKYYNIFAKGVNLFSKYFSLGMSYFCIFILGEFSAYDHSIEWWKYTIMAICGILCFYNYLKVKIK
jgi:hypothetical protein